MSTPIPSFTPYATPYPAASWQITTADLGWIILAWLLGGVLLNTAINWLYERYELNGHRLVRRWYGQHAQVRLRFDAPPQPGRMGLFWVLAWNDEHTPVPWLLVQNLDDAEGVEAFWAPVTDFAPYAVRRFRPHFLRYGMRNRAVLIPWLTAYRPLRQPAGYPGGGS